MFHFFRVSKIFMRQRGRPRFSAEKFLPHGSGKPRRRTLLCFRNFLVSNSFLDKRGGWREYHDFPSEFFCRRVPKIFVVEPFCAVLQNFSGGDKVY